MTDDQLAALAARLREGCRDPVTGERLRPGEFAGASIEDVEAAAEYLRQCAESERAIVPEGWKLVPVEPTVEMVVAAFDAIPASLLDGKIRTHYRAMLAAAPHPPSAEAEPTIDINIKIAVPENWSNRLDMQWIVEREIHADRWSWSYAAPQAMNTQADAIEALRELVEALDGAYISSWQSTAAWQTQLDRARAVLAAQGGKDAL